MIGFIWKETLIHFKDVFKTLFKENAFKSILKEKRLLKSYTVFAKIMKDDLIFRYRFEIKIASKIKFYFLNSTLSYINIVTFMYFTLLLRFFSYKFWGIQCHVSRLFSRIEIKGSNKIQKKTGEEVKDKTKNCTTNEIKNLFQFILKSSIYFF